MVAGSWLYCGPVNKDLSQFGCAYLDTDKKKYKGAIDRWAITIVGPNRERIAIEKYVDAPADSPWNVLFDIPAVYVGKIFDIEGSLSINGSQQTDTSRGCPVGYIVVPGDDFYGTKSFCVMKYEAKRKAGTDLVESKVDGVFADGSGTFADVRKLCQNVGGYFDMISNDEWMTIAANIARTDLNWSGGSVGKGSINRGHSEDYPAVPLNASTDDNPCFGTGKDHCTDPGHLDWSQKRTHSLSNGEILWDISGNRKEWVNRVVKEGEVIGAGEAETAAGYYREYSAFRADFVRIPLIELRPTHATHAWWDESWNSVQGIGCWQISTDSISQPGDGNNTYLLRGGARGLGASVGIFAQRYVAETHEPDVSTGIRCVFRKPTSL